MKEQGTYYNTYFFLKGQNITKIDQPEHVLERDVWLVCRQGQPEQAILGPGSATGTRQATGQPRISQTGLSFSP